MPDEISRLMMVEERWCTDWLNVDDFYAEVGELWK